jgi:hypothetical protein
MVKSLTSSRKLDFGITMSTSVGRRILGTDVSGPSQASPCGTDLWRTSGVPRGGWGVQPPPPEILKALQNHAKLIPIVKTVKNC